MAGRHRYQLVNLLVRWKALRKLKLITSRHAVHGECLGTLWYAAVACSHKLFESLLPRIGELSVCVCVCVRVARLIGHWNSAA